MGNKFKGILSIIIAAIIFGLMPLFARYIFANGGNPISLVFYRSFLAIPALFLINKKKKIDFKICREQIIKLTLLSIFGYSATAILLYLSYNYISTGLATTIHFIYPILVTLACVILYKEKISIFKILSVILSTIGIYLFLNDIGGLNALGIGLSLLSGATFAFYIVYFDKSGLGKMNTFKVTYYLSIISSVLIFIFSLITKTFTIKITLYGWLFMIGFSHAVTIVAVTLFQYGITMIGSQNASIISTFEPITSVIVGVLIFNEDFNVKILIGCIVILLAVVILSFEKQKEENLETNLETN